MATPTLSMQLFGERNRAEARKHARSEAAIKAWATRRQKAKNKAVAPKVESPNWGHLQATAETVIDLLGGPKGAASKLSWEKFYTLTILASLNLDAEKSAAPIFGTRWLS
jgi:hypothetical protein